MSKTKWVLAAVAGMGVGGYFMAPSEAPTHAVPQTACDENFIRSQTPVQKITNEQKRDGLLIEGKDGKRTVCREFLEGAVGRTITLDQEPTKGQKAANPTEDQLKEARTKAIKDCRKANNKEKCIEDELNLHLKLLRVYAKFE